MPITRNPGKKTTKDKAHAIEKDHRPTIPKAQRLNLYENLGPLFDKATQRRVGLRVFCPAYAQDPSAAAAGIEDIDLLWEPGLADGPTSSRLAVVDYDADTGKLTEPARWDEKQWAFVDPRGNLLTAWNFTDNNCGPLTDQIAESFHFHQVNVWATVQSVIDFYEDPWVLGRSVPWAFAGNRLILVPHAGYGENAYYDRASKSLQLYYYGDPGDPKYTCLSHDILAHETGHAILDGVRPYYHQHSSPQTTAFHEFVADFTAVLTAFRNNVLRGLEARLGDLGNAKLIANLAQEFGRSVEGRPYLRTAHNDLTMADIKGDIRHHRIAQVLTGALFDILVGLTHHYLHRWDPRRKKAPTARQAFWWAADRIRRIAFQPLDYLPPVDVQFLDYVRAVLRCHDLANPQDPQGYRGLMLKTFHDRGLCRLSATDHEEGRCDLHPDPLPYSLVHHDFDRLTSSPTAAYRFLHDNRKNLRIPDDQDLEVADLYVTHKWDVGRTRLPREVVLEYTWKESLGLDDSRFGPLRGQTVNLLCGGTLVFDGQGNVVSWARKPGTQVGKDAQAGARRKEQFLDHVARQARSGALGLIDDAEADQLGQLGPPVVARLRDGAVQLEVASCFRGAKSADRKADEGEDEPHETGAESWTTSF